MRVFTAEAAGESGKRDDVVSVSGNGMPGLMIRAIQAFVVLTTVAAVDSGNTALPIPLATAAVSVAMESISQ